MQRLTRIIDALGSDAVIVVVTRLLAGPASQKALLAALKKERIEMAQPRLSEVMTRLGDLGVVTRRSTKTPYVLAHQQETAAFLLHLAALGAAIARADSAGAEEMERLARRARLRTADHDNDAEDA